MMKVNVENIKELEKISHHLDSNDEEFQGKKLDIKYDFTRKGKFVGEQLPYNLDDYGDGELTSSSVDFIEGEILYGIDRHDALLRRCVPFTEEYMDKMKNEKDPFKKSLMNSPQVLPVDRDNDLDGDFISDDDYKVMREYLTGEVEKCSFSVSIDFPIYNRTFFTRNMRPVKKVRKEIRDNCHTIITNTIKLINVQEKHNAHDSGNM